MRQQRSRRARREPSHPARPTTSKNPCKGSLAQLVEQLTFNQLVAGSNPARPTNVKKRPKGAFLLSAICYLLSAIRKFRALFLPDGGFALSGLQNLSKPGFRRPAKRSASRHSVMPLSALPDGGFALSGLQHLSVPGFRRPAKRSASRRSVLPLSALPDGGFALSGLQHLSKPGFRRPAKRSASGQLSTLSIPPRCTNSPRQYLCNRVLCLVYKTSAA